MLIYEFKYMVKTEKYDRLHLVYDFTMWTLFGDFLAKF